MSKELLSVTHYMELSLQQCGRERCIPSKYIAFDPLPFHIIHCVISGKGYLEVGKTKYAIGKNSLFFIPANSTVNYYPDKDDPWTYMWVGFSGTTANLYLHLMGFENNNYVMKVPKENKAKDYLSKMVEHYQEEGQLDIRCLGLCYEFFYEIINCNQERKKEQISFVDSHILNAKQYIYNNYQFQISVNDIASNVGVTPNYLANIFHKYEKMTTKQFLIKVRMENAKSMLLTSNYKIKDVSKSVGYVSQLYFSNEFKKYFGIYPLEMIKKSRIK